MPRMIELIRKSSLSATLMHAAARGALAVPPAEMLEILVYLANHNKIFGEQARLTLAGWDENASRAAAADPNTAREVLDYFAAPQNTRPPLIPALLENPAITQAMLQEMASRGSREVADAMAESERVKANPALLEALKANPNVIWSEVAARPNEAAKVPKPDTASVQGHATATPEIAETGGDEEVVHAFLAEHAKELAAEASKPFQPIGGIPEAVITTAEAPPEITPAATIGVTGAAAAPQRAQAKKAFLNPEDERGSALQKIAKLDVKGRIQLAMKGTKEERSILVRDGTKLVAIAVLESPKVGDGEVEKIASQKNVLEAVLRAIPMKRRFAKNYSIVRNLVFNPRTPLDVSLGLMKNMLVHDLRNLSGNKEVSETVRKLALRMFKQKADAGKKE
jgi:hypothetical protein